MTYSAISDVNAVLVELLRESATDDRSPIDPGGVAVTSPSDVDSLADLDVGLFPYHVETNNLSGSVSNNPSGTTRQDPPLSLTVRYLLTAYGGDEEEGTGGEGGGLADATAWGDRLGAALQVLHDNSQIDPENAPAPLYQDRTLTITVVDESFDDLLSLWSQFDDASYRPSATVEVSPVVVQSLNEEEFTRVQERETSVGRHEPEEPEEDDGSWL